MWEVRFDKVSKAGMLVLAGYILCMGVNHVKDLWSDHGNLVVMQRKVVPALVAKVNCEHRRAEHNEHVAQEAIKGAVSDTAPIPSPAQIQTSCPKK